MMESLPIKYFNYLPTFHARISFQIKNILTEDKAESTKDSTCHSKTELYNIVIPTDLYQR